jgi:branched-chain amino acid transport system substrate-binding protein
MHLFTIRCLSSICIFSLLMLSTGCGKKETIKIGYVGGLISATGDLGISGREGAVLAVEMHNNQPGSVPVDLITVNDAQKKQHLEEAIRKLLRLKVKGIVGPMTSSMAQFALPLINEHQLISVSPTSSSSYLDGLNDYLFKTYPSSKQLGVVLAEYVFDVGIRSIGIIVDLDNAAHSNAFADEFQLAFVSLGGTVDFNLSYKNSEHPVFNDLIGGITSWPGGLLILSNSTDSAVICQQLKKRNLDVPVFASEWSSSGTLFLMGGKAVEGMVIVSAIDPSDKNESFQSAFRNRFDREADFAAILSYDATTVLIEAILNGRDSKQYLLQKKEFPGLQGLFSFDEYGDPKREIHILKAINGKFETLR